MKKILCFFLLCIYLHLFADSLSTKTMSQLIERAKEAQQKAYAPYSNYNVGAAIFTQSGKIYTGCNIENSSYGLTICAERTALFKAVSEGEKNIEAIAMITKNGSLCCGSCRQVLSEFNPKMIVISVDEKGQICHQKPLNQLLPDAFGPWESY